MKTTDFINKKAKPVVEAKVEAPAEVKELVFPKFTFEDAEAHYKKELNEMASAGASCAAGVGGVVKNLGEMPTEIIKRQKGYTNQLTKGGAVKMKKSK